MGMLIRRHRDRNKGAKAPAPKPGSKAALVAEAEALGLSTDGNKAALEQRIADHKAEPENTEPSENPFAELTDDEVAEAYATNVGGEATERDEQEAALAELDAGDDENTEDDTSDE